MTISRVSALSIVAGVGAFAGYSAPATADVTVLRCVGGPPLMAAIDLEKYVFYLRHPFVRAWDVRVIGQMAYIPGMGQLSLTDGTLKWGRYVYRCDMSPS